MSTSRRTTSAEARARILASAAKLIEERGAASLSVTEVMRHARITRSTFYRQFTDLYAVIAETLTLISREILSESGAWMTDPDAVGHPGVIHQNLLTNARAYARHGPLLRALADTAAGNERIWSIYRHEVLQSVMDATARAIARDQAAGVVRPSLDAVASARALTLMDERMSYDLLGRPGDGSPEEYARILTPIWTATLFGVPPGPAKEDETHRGSRG